MMFYNRRKSHNIMGTIEDREKYCFVSASKSEISLILLWFGTGLIPPQFLDLNTQ